LGNAGPLQRLFLIAVQSSSDLTELRNVARGFRSLIAGTGNPQFVTPPASPPPPLNQATAQTSVIIHVAAAKWLLVHPSIADKRGCESGAPASADPSNLKTESVSALYAKCVNSVRASPGSIRRG
jgi:hypothetical protein